MAHMLDLDMQRHYTSSSSSSSSSSLIKISAIAASNRRQPDLEQHPHASGPQIHSFTPNHTYGHGTGK
eukprot:1138299-Pelagomonas_calceolata.AAC.2